MNRVLPVLALCLSLLALAMALVPRGDVAPPPTVMNAPPANDEELDFLRRRVDQLEDDNRNLWVRVTQLERRPVDYGDGGNVPASLAADVEKLRAEVHSLVAGDIGSSEAGRAALRDMIREVQGDQQRDRMMQLEERRAQQAAAQQARWKEFSTKAKLSYAAEQKLNDRLAFEDAERAKQMEKLRLGTATWQDVSQSIRQQRKETDEAVGALMDDSQRQQYQQIRRGDSSGRTDAQRQNVFQNGLQRGGNGKGR